MAPKRHSNKVHKLSNNCITPSSKTSRVVDASTTRTPTGTRLLTQEVDTVVELNTTPAIMANTAAAKTIPLSSNNENCASTTHTTTTTTPTSSWWVNELPHELQVKILSYLRATDLSKVHQINTYMATNKVLHHDIVLYCSEQVYPTKWTDGFQYQPTTSTPTILPPNTSSNSHNMINLIGSTKGGKVTKGKPRSCSFGSLLDSNDDGNHSVTNAIKTRCNKSRSSSLGSIEDTTNNTSSVRCSSAATEQSTKQQELHHLSPVIMKGIAQLTKQQQEEQLLSNQSFPQQLYTFEHLRNMELLVVARVLNSPEPTTGFVVSKSWCKTALCWLESQQERRYEQQQQQFEATNSSNKKKKQQAKKISKSKTTKKSHQRASSPPPNINSDITCAHNQLQHCTSTKSARARRRLLDKQAWKILKVLYPESTPIPAQSGECIQCIAEACQVQKTERDQQEAIKELRKLPLQNAHVRRFYTRTRGVPEACLRKCHDEKTSPSSMDQICSSGYNKDEGSCPLMDGTYYVLPRSWCHGWRRFMKSGEGGVHTNSHSGFSQQQAYAPPDASCLLCDAHRLALLPPHLELYLYGESDNLFDSSNIHKKVQSGDSISLLMSQSPNSIQYEITGNARQHQQQFPILPIGQGPTQESILAMRSLGLDESEIGRQLTALRAIEARNERLNRSQQLLAEENSIASRNELLDQENYNVVEILSEMEFRSLIGCWPASTSVYVLRFIVHRGIVTTIAATTERDSIVGLGQEEMGSSGADFCISVCRNCDATGRYHCVKGKQRCSRSCNSNSWNNKKYHHNTNHDRSRTTPSLEY